jgi:Holliday junction resolvase RusA-like endonuclease
VSTVTELRFVAFGRPQGKGSKRALPIRGKARHGQHIVLVDSNRNAKPWAALVSAAAGRAVFEASRGATPRLIQGPVMVELDFHFARPKAHFGTGRNSSRLRLSAPSHMVTVPDIDKLTRCALDALTGVIYADDSQVSELSVRKRFGEPERMEATVCPL